MSSRSNPGGIGNFGLGLGIVVFYLVFIFGVFAGFSGYLSRVNLEKELATGRIGAAEAQLASLDQLIFLFNREERLRREAAEFRRRIDEAYPALNELSLELLRLREDERIARRALTRSLDEAIWAVKNGGAELPKEAVEPLFAHHDRLLRGEARIEEGAVVTTLALLKNVTVVGGDGPARSATSASIVRIGGFRDEHDRTRSLVEEASLRYSGQGQLIERWEGEAGARAEALAQRAALLSDEHRSVINSFAASLLGVPFLMLKIPTILLTLIVTISAGGLGAIVSFTRRFLFSGRGAAAGPGDGPRDPDLGRLLLNVGEGVAASIAIFLFAGAGMLMLTQGGGAGGENVELSPYMVAFIAFVSGFMAEDAFAKIQESGRNIFKVETANGQGDPGDPGEPEIPPVPDAPDSPPQPDETPPEAPPEAPPAPDPVPPAPPTEVPVPPNTPVQPRGDRGGD